MYFVQLCPILVEVLGRTRATATWRNSISTWRDNEVYSWESNYFGRLRLTVFHRRVAGPQSLSINPGAGMAVITSYLKVGQSDIYVGTQSTLIHNSGSLCS